MDLLWTVFVKQFCIDLVSLHHQVIKGTKNLERNFLKRNKSILSHIKYYLEDDDHRTVDFNNEMLSFNCLLITI